MIAPEDITLIPLAREHLALVRAWRNRPDIARWFFGGAVSEEQHEHWFQGYEADDSDHTFVVAWQGRPVGMMSVYHVDRAARSAEFGRFLIGDPGARGRGVAQAAGRRLAALAFSALGVDRLSLSVFADNEPALRVYAALGFRRTGRGECAPPHGGPAVPVVTMELLKSEFSGEGGA